MTELERTYNIPLRKGFMKAPRYMRANKAVKVLRSFLERHMKSNNVKIGPYLNSKILEHGRKNILHHIEVKAIKDKDGIVKAEYLKAKNFDFLRPKEEAKKEEEVKLKIPGFGKKKEGLEKKAEVLREEEKKEILEHPPHKKEIPPIEQVPMDKEKGVMIKEDKIYGRLKGKKTKVKERAKKNK